MNCSDVGSSDVPLSNPSQCKTAWTQGLKLAGEGEVLAVFWSLISRWHSGRALLNVHLISCPWRGKHKIPYLSAGRLTTVLADSFRFGASFTIGGEKKICWVPWGVLLQVWTTSWYCCVVRTTSIVLHC